MTFHIHRERESQTIFICCVVVTWNLLNVNLQSVFCEDGGWILFFLLGYMLLLLLLVRDTQKWMNASEWKHDEVNFSHIVVTNLFHCATTAMATAPTTTTHSLCLLCFCYFVQIALIVIKWIYSSTMANAFNQRTQTLEHTCKYITLCTNNTINIFLRWNFLSLLSSKRLLFPLSFLFHFVRDIENAGLSPLLNKWEILRCAWENERYNFSSMDRWGKKEWEKTERNKKIHKIGGKHSFILPYAG